MISISLFSPLKIQSKPYAKERVFGPAGTSKTHRVERERGEEETGRGRRREARIAQLTLRDPCQEKKHPVAAHAPY